MSALSQELAGFIKQDFFKRPIVTDPGGDVWTVQHSVVDASTMSDALKGWLWTAQDGFLKLSGMEMLCGCVLRDPAEGGMSQVNSSDALHMLGISPDGRQWLVTIAAQAQQ